jgi:peptidoglycan/xylan/chitin deacetylase (PgdA/CDA1 family)
MSVLGRIRALGTKLRRPRPRGLILMYHRVTAGIADPWRLCVSPENFAQQLDELKRSWRVTSLEELATRTDGGGRPLPVAITFDDGYADNLHAGVPALADRGLPATFFVVSGMVDAAREFWWDELERLLLRPGSLPAAISIPMARERRQFPIGAAAAAAIDPVVVSAAARPWEASAGTRLGFFYSVWQALQTLDDDGRREALAAIRDQLSSGDTPRPSHRIMTAAELRRLAATPRIAVGAHSVTHAALSAHDPDDQLREMERSKRDLEAMIERRVRGFAYPYGDLGPTTSRLAELAGFEFACTTEEGLVSAQSHPFELPRVAVGDWDGPTFAARLAGFVH